MTKPPDANVAAPAKVAGRTRAPATLRNDYGDYAMDVLRECQKTYWSDEWQDARRQYASCLVPLSMWPFDYPHGFARVRFHGDTFDLHDGGVRALLLAVTDEFGEIVDLCAVGLDDDKRAATLGLGSWCLGASNIPFSNSMGGALLVHETVWEWLASGGDGIFITNYRRAVRFLHDYSVEGVEVCSYEFGERLDKRLRDSLPVPKILGDLGAA